MSFHFLFHINFRWHLRYEMYKIPYCLCTTWLRDLTVCVSRVIRRRKITKGFFTWKYNHSKKLMLLTCFLLYIFVNLIIWVGNLMRNICRMIYRMTCIFLNFVTDMIRKSIYVMRLNLSWFTRNICSSCFRRFRWRLRSCSNATFRRGCRTVVSQRGSWSSI